MKTKKKQEKKGIRTQRPGTETPKLRIEIDQRMKK